MSKEPKIGEERKEYREKEREKEMRQAGAWSAQWLFVEGGNHSCRRAVALQADETRRD